MGSWSASTTAAGCWGFCPRQFIDNCRRFCDARIRQGLEVRASSWRVEIAQQALSSWEIAHLYVRITRKHHIRPMSSVWRHTAPAPQRPGVVFHWVARTVRGRSQYRSSPSRRVELRKASSDSVRPPTTPLLRSRLTAANVAYFGYAVSGTVRTY